MPFTTTYTIVPFLADAAGRLRPAAPRRSKSREAAIAAADTLVPFYAGVIVLKERSNPPAGLFPEPTLICVIGEVPDGLITALAA